MCFFFSPILVCLLKFPSLQYLCLHSRLFFFPLPPVAVSAIMLTRREWIVWHLPSLLRPIRSKQKEVFSWLLFSVLPFVQIDLFVFAVDATCSQLARAPGYLFFVVPSTWDFMASYLFCRSWPDCPCSSRKLGVVRALFPKEEKKGARDCDRYRQILNWRQTDLRGAARREWKTGRAGWEG